MSGSVSNNTHKSGECRLHIMAGVCLKSTMRNLLNLLGFSESKWMLIIWVPGTDINSNIFIHIREPASWIWLDSGS